MIAFNQNHKGREDTEAQRCEMVDSNPISAEINDLSNRVIGAAIEVHRSLGPGFVERTYGRALAIELRHQSIRFDTEVPVDLRYRGEVIGSGRMDFVVESELVLELKATELPARQYRRQVAAYLKGSGLQLGLLINFGSDPLKEGIARIINT